MAGAQIADRLRAYADMSAGADGCWPWQRSLNRDGYGQLRDGARSRGAHCVAYEVRRGPIPRGKQIDHVCHNADLSCPGGRGCAHRRCVNPAHLEAVPSRINTLRGKGLAAMHARSSTCRNGHPVGEESRRSWNGWRGRFCLICHRESGRRTQSARRKTPEYRASHAAYMRAKRQAAR